MKRGGDSPFAAFAFFARYPVDFGQSRHGHPHQLQPARDLLIVRAVSEQPEDFNVPTWKFFVALVIVLIGVMLGTMLWMWRENKPRRRPAILGAPQTVRTNAPGQ